MAWYEVAPFCLGTRLDNPWKKVPYHGMGPKFLALFSSTGLWPESLISVETVLPIRIFFKCDFSNGVRAGKPPSGKDAGSTY